MSHWEDMLAAYTPEQQERLELAATAQAERVEAAAVDPSDSRIQDGIDISAVWFAVLRRREQLGASTLRVLEAPEPVVEAEPEVQAPEAVEEPVKAPAAPKAAPAKRTGGRPRKTS